MSDDCGHDLDANYRYPSDVDVLGTANDGDGTVFTPALPCPECGAALEVEARSETVVEGDFELPLDDSLYDCADPLEPPHSTSGRTGPVRRTAAASPPASRPS